MLRADRQSPEQTRPAPLDALLAGITADPGGEHSVASLSDAPWISPRHLTQLFNKHKGTTAARWVERVRCDCARDRLQSTSDCVEEVSRAAGFARPVTMRHAFRRVSESRLPQLRRTDTPKASTPRLAGGSPHRLSG